MSARVKVQIWSVLQMCHHKPPNRINWLAIALFPLTQSISFNLPFVIIVQTVHFYLNLLSGGCLIINCVTSRQFVGDSFSTGFGTRQQISQRAGKLPLLAVSSDRSVQTSEAI